MAGELSHLHHGAGTPLPSARVRPWTYAPPFPPFLCARCVRVRPWTYIFRPDLPLVYLLHISPDTDY